VLRLQAIGAIASSIFFVLFGASCADDREQESYCRAVEGSVSTEAIEVEKVLIYGAAPHGAFIFSTACPKRSMTLSIPLPKDDAPAAMKVKLLRRALYDQPKRSGGMFEVDGIVDFDLEPGVASLIGVTRFREVSQEERRAALDELMPK